MTTKEIDSNICIEAGCLQPSCCQDTKIALANDEELGRFPNAIYDPTYEKRRGGPGFYYSERNVLSEKSGPYEGEIIGACENQTTLPSGARCCRIYDKRPLACQTFERGGHCCTRFRKRDGLSPVKEKDY